MIAFRTASLLGFLLALIHPVASFSFNFSSRVSQCADLSVMWDGGTPPWNLVLLPVGKVEPEIRTIVDETITSGNEHRFTLKFPTGSSFIAMMSDATGVGTGGTSILITVLDGPSGCLSSPTTPLFYFSVDYIYPSQCGTLPISWNSSVVRPPLRMTAVVPGGQSFALPVPSSGSSLNWQTNLRTGTDFLLVAGDSRGFGTGGSSELWTVRDGGSGCINQSSPSSTAAPAAGGIYATGSGGGTVTGAPHGTGAPNSPGGGGKKTNIGAIVGGVLGGVAAILAILLVLLIWYRKRKGGAALSTGTKRRRESVDLLNEVGDQPDTAESHLDGTTNGATRATTPGLEAGETSAMSQASHGGPVSNRLSVASLQGTEYSQTTGTGVGGRRLSDYSSARDSPIPRLPPLSVSGDGTLSDAGFGSNFGAPLVVVGGRDRAHPPSAFANHPGNQRPITPTTEGTSLRTPVTRKSGAGPAPLRAVNFVQHDDAGQVPEEPSASGPAQEEVVELPPSYAEVQTVKGMATQA